jgi:uncharacterized protein YggE
MLTVRHARPWGRFGRALAVGLLVFPVAAANAQEKTPLSRRLTVTGQGEVRIKPDKADIVIGVMTEDKSSQTAVKANADASQKVQAAVKQQGVVDKDIQTVNYSVQPLMVGGGGFGGDQRPNVKPAITGYRVNNQVRVTVRDLSKMGDILDAATNAGSNTIENISFGREDQDAAENEAMGKAVADARRRADILAKAAGVRLIGILEINNSPAFRPVAAYDNSMVFKAAATPIALGELSVTSSVTIVYELSSELLK